MGDISYDRGTAGNIQVRGSWSTSDPGQGTDYITVNFNITVSSIRGFTVSENPKLLIYGMPNTPFDSSTASDLSGDSMISFVNNNGGQCTLIPLGSGKVSAGEVGSINTSFRVSKTPNARDVTLYFGTATQSTYFWSMLSGEVSATINVPSSYKAPSGFKISHSASSTSSITGKASWTDGTKTSSATISTDNKSKSISNGGTAAITDLKSNTQYKVSGSLSDGTTTLSSSFNAWTYPVINKPTLARKTGSEHNTINVSVSASVASSYDQFAYKLGNTSWSPWTSDKTYSFGSLSENTSYTIHVKMKNTNSGYESAEQSASITTWYNPLTNLTVNLVNKWFWYLQINCSFTYNGTISKYEFAIGDDQSFVTTTGNSHSRGSTSPTGTGKLDYNTNYNCQVRLTDNHGRTYGFNGTTHTFANAKLPFKTLDERPLYVNGELREVKVIKSDGSMEYITPNLLTVVQENGSTVNMNKIINNDNRISYN